MDYYRILIICLIFIIFTKWLWGRRHLYILSMQVQGPFSLPFIGSIIPIFKFLSNEPVDIASKECEKYSGPFRAWLGTHLFIVAFEPEDVENLYCHSVVAKVPQLAKAWSEGMGYGVVTMSNIDDYSVWKLHRKIMNPTLTAAAIKLYFEAIRNVSEILQKDMDDLCDKGLIDITPIVRRFTADATTESMFNMSLDFRRGDKDHIIESTETILKCTYNKLLKFWNLFEPLYRFSTMRKMQLKARDNLKGLAEVIYKTKINDYLNKPKDDIQELNFINVLIKSKLDGLMTEDEVIGEVMNLWTAASDTPGNALEFLLLMLAMHKDCQNKAFDEIYSFFKRHTTVEWSNLDEFPYLDMCMKESMRLFPTGPISLRYTTKEFVMQNRNIKIPPGTNLAVVSYYTMRHPKIWDDPTTFKPERFNPESSAKRHPFAYNVFSRGTRKCPGYSFVKVLTKLCLIYVLRKYELHSEWILKDIPLNFDISIRSQWGYFASVTRRKVSE